MIKKGHRTAVVDHNNNNNIRDIPIWVVVYFDDNNIEKPLKVLIVPKKRTD
jgi:hypothetical protein